MEADNHIPILQAYPKPSGTGRVFALQAGQSSSRPDDGLQVRVESLQQGSDPAATARVTLTLSNAAGSTVLPAQTGEVTIAGGAGVGSTLTAATSGWADAACRQYQWFDDGVEIPGARAATYTVPDTADGHRISVRVTGFLPGSAQRVVSSAPVLIGAPADTDPPETTITSPVPAPADSTPTFAFSADESSTFECTIDGGGFAPCTSPHTVDAVSPGAHAFQVRATDLAGNADATPASLAFVVAAEPSPPEAPTGEPSDGGSVRGDDDASPATGAYAGRATVDAGSAGLASSGGSVPGLGVLVGAALTAAGVLLLGMRRRHATT